MTYEIEIKLENKEAAKLRKEAAKRGIPPEQLIKEYMAAYVEKFRAEGKIK